MFDMINLETDKVEQKRRQKPRIDDMEENRKCKENCKGKENCKCRENCKCKGHCTLQFYSEVIVTIQDTEYCIIYEHTFFGW